MNSPSPEDRSSHVTLHKEYIETICLSTTCQEFLHGHIVDFLQPPDVHALGEAYAMYKPHLGRSLNNSLSLVLKSGSHCICLTL